MQGFGGAIFDPQKWEQKLHQKRFWKDDVIEKFLMRFKILGPTKLYSEDFLGVQYCL